ncbi:MAG TPA: DUF4330 domain-containing protein [Oculatellaceae cyanobacterium]|jgi:hypothetical protein
MWIDQSGRLFGKINVIDFLSLALILLAALGMIAVQSGWHKTSGQVIRGEGDIQYTILIRNLKTLQPDLFQPGKKLSITIRNQPRGEVPILDVKRNPRRTSFMGPNGQLQTIEDPADPYGYDYLITLRDHALFTQDGYVAEGIKVKIGLSIEVEGKNYRVPGVIVDVREASDRAS